MRIVTMSQLLPIVLHLAVMGEVALAADEMEAVSVTTGRVAPQLRGASSLAPQAGAAAVVGSSPFFGASAEPGPVLAASEPSKVADLSDVVVLQGGYASGGFQQGGFQQQGGYQQGVQPGSYNRGSFGQDGGSNIMVSVIVTVLVLVCACCCVIQLMRCICGEVCGGNLDPMLGAGLGAVAGYEMGQYMDGGYGQQPMY